MRAVKRLIAWCQGDRDAIGSARSRLVSAP